MRNGNRRSALQISDEAAMEELYVKRKGKRIGSYYWESAAYRAGIITKKPKVEYILCPNSKRNMFRMERIGQTNVKVRAPYAKIDALNLLIYAGEHPEHKREVEEWILKKGISVADMGVEE